MVSLFDTPGRRLDFSHVPPPTSASTPTFGSAPTTYGLECRRILQKRNAFFVPTWIIRPISIIARWEYLNLHPNNAMGECTPTPLDGTRNNDYERQDTAGKYPKRMTGGDEPDLIPTILSRWQIGKHRYFSR